MGSKTTWPPWPWAASPAMTEPGCWLTSKAAPDAPPGLEELSGATDALTALVPEVTPPEGFAERTVARFRAEQKTTRRPLTGRLLAAAAVVVTLALGAGVGEVVAVSQGAAPATRLPDRPSAFDPGDRGHCGACVDR